MHLQVKIFLCRKDAFVKRYAMAELKLQSSLLTNYSLFVLPSWQAITGAPPGKYINENVSKIESDPVIFFTGKEAAVKSSKATNYYLFGLGYYYLKFELSGGKYVIDQRPLTGLILSDFVYDNITTSTQLALEDDPDVILCEKAFKIPLHLAMQKRGQALSFIKGFLTRYVLTPFKESLLKLMNLVREDPTSYRFTEWGHLLLSTRRDHFNQLLMSDRMAARKDDPYNKITAGLDSVVKGADALLFDTFESQQMQEIAGAITQLKTALTAMQIDPMDLYSILEGTGKFLEPPQTPSSSPGGEDSRTGFSKKCHLLALAEERSMEIIPWPSSFPEPPATTGREYLGEGSQAARPDIKDLVHDFQRKVDAMGDVDPTQLTATKVDQVDRSQFQIRSQQRPTVHTKDLPDAPKRDIEELLVYLKWVVDEKFDLPTIAKAFGMARDNLREIQINHPYIFPISRFYNKYQLEEAGQGLSPREEEEISRAVETWLNEVLEEKRREQERIERERLEKERKEREERERIERERLESERQERERLERERLERERQEKERLERERLEQERKKREEQERLERERLAAEEAERERIRLAAPEVKLQMKADELQEKLTKANADLKQAILDTKRLKKEAKTLSKELKKVQKQQAKLQK